MALENAPKPTYPARAEVARVGTERARRELSEHEFQDVILSEADTTP